MLKADRINPYKCSGRVKRNGRYVRFGSLADICGAKRHVRFTPESGHPVSGMISASVHLQMHLNFTAAPYLKPYSGRYPNSLGLFFDLADSRVDLILSD